MRNLTALSDQTRTPESDKRLRLTQRWGVSLGALIVAVLGVAACGGGSSHNPGVARASTTPTSRAATAGGGTRATGPLAYAVCVRSHGIPNFPDPDSSGIFPKTDVRAATAGMSVSQFRAQTQPCDGLLPPAPPSQTITAQDQQDYLNAAACMRSHGFSNFPDPTFSNGNVNVSVPPGINTHSAQFTQAAQICTRLIPAGLPYTRPDGS